MSPIVPLNIICRLLPYIVDIGDAQGKISQRDVKSQLLTKIESRAEPHGKYAAPYSVL